jgi:hypothetical protein
MTDGAKPRGPRGLLDALLCAALVYGVYAATPIGALAENGVRAALGQKHRASLLATFSGRDLDVHFPEDALTPVDPERPVHDGVQVAAKKTEVPATLLAAWVDAHGSCEGTACRVQRPPAYSEWLPTAAVVEKIPLEDAALALKKALADLGHPEPAFEALFIGGPAVKRAMDQARATGLLRPEEVSVHAAFIAPGLKRGPLQDALAVLARHRLSTLAWPMDPALPITSPFGMRTHPVTGRKKLHNGVDIGAGVGRSVMSAHRGRVKRRGQDSTCGIYLRVDHGFGIETTYCHLNAAEADADEWVKRGQDIAQSGATGRVTGPHLHYILRLQGKAVDPLKHQTRPKKKGAS